MSSEMAEVGRCFGDRSSQSRSCRVSVRFWWRCDPCLSYDNNVAYSIRRWKAESVAVAGQQPWIIAEPVFSKMVGVPYLIIAVYFSSAYVNCAKDCPKLCDCLGDYVDCSQKSLTSVPSKIPKWTSKLWVHYHLLFTSTDRTCFGVLFLHPVHAVTSR